MQLASLSYNSRPALEVKKLDTFWGNSLIFSIES